MSVRIEFPGANSLGGDIADLVGADEMGITAIELDDDGRTLTVVGWFDQVANWKAIVELDDEQADELREGLRR